MNGTKRSSGIHDKLIMTELNVEYQDATYGVESRESISRQDTGQTLGHLLHIDILKLKAMNSALKVLIRGGILSVLPRQVHGCARHTPKRPCE